MNCQFCLTGRVGLLGNLSAAQIVEQVVAAKRFLAQVRTQNLTKKSLSWHMSRLF